jgi:hypothetical protein
LRNAVELVTMACRTLHLPTDLTAMPSLQKLTMRPKNGTWIRTVRIYGRRGACVREMAMN